MNVFELDFPDNDSYGFREYPVLTEYEMIHQSIIPDMSGTPRTGIRRCEST